MYLLNSLNTISTVESRFNEPLFNEVLDITNDTLRPGQNYSKMYGVEPRYNEFLGITNIIRKPKRELYLNKMLNRSTVSKSFNPYGKETATFHSTVYYMS